MCSTKLKVVMASSDHDHKETGKIKVISECFIRPKYEVEASKQPHYLGPIDILFLSLEHMQKGLLFNSKPQNIQSNLLDKLKITVSHSLVHFYPLAGKLATQNFHDEHAIWVYVDCINAPGARLIHAAALDMTVSDILSCTDVHPIVSSFFDIGEKVVNYDGHTRPLLSIQVTELLDGVFIGFMMNHSLADGTSLWHFISILSEIFLQLEDGDGKDVVGVETKNSKTDTSMIINISRKPLYNPFFPEGYGPILKLPYLEPEEFTARFDPGPLRERIFRFSSKAMSMLKSRAKEECGGNNISSFQALTGLLWRSITSVRNINPNLDTTCSLIINWRARLKPPFSQDHFGNYLAVAEGTCKVGELLGHHLGWAASLVHQSVKTQDDSAIREFLYNYAKAPYMGRTGADPVFNRSNNVSIAGSSKFDMYGPKFGIGKAVAVLAGYANKGDGKATANPGREKGGSVDLEVCLKQETMDALESNEEFMSFVS